MPDLSAITAPDPTAALFANLAAKQSAPAGAPNVQAATTPPLSSVGAVAQPSPNLTGAVVPAGLDQLIVSREGSGPQAVSPKGAEGEHQVLPSTAVPYLYPGANPNDPAVQARAKAALLDPATNQRVGRAVIADLWKKYRDPQVVMVAYNAGPGVADKWIASGKDPSVLPAETQKYIGATDSDGNPSPNTQARTELKSQLADITKQTQAIIDQINKEGGRGEDTLKQLAQLRDRQQEYQDAALQLAKTPPVPNPRDAIQRFGGLATVVGILGGLFTKAPLTASLNAAGAAMEAYNKQDEAGFKQHYDAWKINSDIMLKMAEMQHQALRDTLYDEHMQSSEKMARLQAVLSALGQERMATMAGLGQEHQLIQEEFALGRTLDASRRTQVEIERLKLQMDEAGEKGWTVMQRPDGTLVRVKAGTGEVQPVDLPAGSGKVGAAQAPVDKTEVDYWTRVVENGGSFPPGLTRTAQGAQLVREVMKNMAAKGSIPGGMTPEDFIANVATVKSDSHSLMNMTKMADAATSFERTASQNFDLALKLSKDAVPTDWGPALNRWIMTGETQFGDMNVPPYVTAMLTGANEYAKIMSGSTGAQGSTVDSRREAAELFSPYLSKGQIERVVAVAKADMQNRKQSLYGQIDDIKSRLRSAGSAAPTATQGQAPAGTTATGPGGEKLHLSPDGSQWLRPDGTSVP